MVGYTIFRLRDGGFFVQSFDHDAMSRYAPPIFASARVGECLEYIRQQLEKPATE